MDDQNMALNEESGVVTTPDTTPVSEQETAEEVTQTEPTGEERVAETDGQSKKGFNARVQELNSRAKEAERRALEAEQEAQSMAQKIAELTRSSRPQGNDPYLPQYEPGTEIAQEQIQRDVVKAAESIVELKLKQQDAINRINSETSEAIREYPELDPKSEFFDKDLSNTVYEAVEAKVRANPYSAEVKKYVDRLMKPYKRSITREVGKVSEKLATQVSQAAARPTSIQKSEKSTAEKSIAELERELGIQTY